MDAYVYGVIAVGAARWRTPGEGVDEQPVALVARVPVKASRRNLMAHSRVLQSVIGARCVLPMRFGVVMPDRAAVEEELLARGGEWLASQLSAFETYVQLDVQALCSKEELLSAVVRERLELAELRESLRGRPG